MPRHRFCDQIEQETWQLAASPQASSGFMACPAAVQQWVGGAFACHEAIYARALSEARKVVRPSILERFAAHIDN